MIIGLPKMALSIEVYIAMILRGCCLCVLFLFSLDTLAIGNFKPTEAQLRTLPEYCKPRATGWGNDPRDPRTKRWFKIFGNDYTHMHHYCDGLKDINEGNRATDKVKRGRYFIHAVQELSYVERNAGKGGTKFKLLPQLYAKMGEAYSGYGDIPNAERYYRKSIREYPKYSRSYMMYINLLIRAERYQDAKEINDLALKQVKKTKFFKNKEKEIDSALAEKAKMR